MLLFIERVLFYFSCERKQKNIQDFIKEHAANLINLLFLFADKHSDVSLLIQCIIALVFAYNIQNQLDRFSALFVTFFIAKGFLLPYQQEKYSSELTEIVPNFFTITYTGKNNSEKLLQPFQELNEIVKRLSSFTMRKILLSGSEIITFLNKLKILLLDNIISPIADFNINDFFNTKKIEHKKMVVLIDAVLVEKPHDYNEIDNNKSFEFLTPIIKELGFDEVLAAILFSLSVFKPRLGFRLVQMTIKHFGPACLQSSFIEKSITLHKMLYVQQHVMLVENAIEEIRNVPDISVEKLQSYVRKFGSRITSAIYSIPQLRDRYISTLQLEQVLTMRVNDYSISSEFGQELTRVFLDLIFGMLIIDKLTTVKTEDIYALLMQVPDKTRIESLIQTYRPDSKVTEWFIQARNDSLFASRICNMWRRDMASFENSSLLTICCQHPSLCILIEADNDLCAKFTLLVLHEKAIPTKLLATIVASSGLINVLILAIITHKIVTRNVFLLIDRFNLDQLRYLLTKLIPFIDKHENANMNLLQMILYRMGQNMWFKLMPSEISVVATKLDISNSQDEFNSFSMICKKINFLLWPYAKSLQLFPNLAKLSGIFDITATTIDLIKSLDNRDTETDWMYIELNSQSNGNGVEKWWFYLIFTLYRVNPLIVVNQYTIANLRQTDTKTLQPLLTKIINEFDTTFENGYLKTELIVSYIQTLIILDEYQLLTPQRAAILDNKKIAAIAFIQAIQLLRNTKFPLDADIILKLLAHTQNPDALWQQARHFSAQAPRINSQGPGYRI